MIKKEREALKNEIAAKNLMTKKIGNWCKNTFFVFLLFLAMAIWGWTGVNDNFLQVSDGLRDVLKWVGLIFAILTGILSLMMFISFRNSKKHILSLIELLNKK